MKRLLAALSVLLALAFAFPLTLQDDLGRTVTLQAPPKRIVTMLPSVTETVCALGACDRIVATDDYSDWPESVKRLPKAGGLYNPNPELIVSLKPDLVLVSKYGRLYETLERAGLTVYAVRTETYEDIFKTVRTLGRLLGLGPRPSGSWPRSRRRSTRRRPGRPRPGPAPGSTTRLTPPPTPWAPRASSASS